jgi:hypothetical protein
MADPIIVATPFSELGELAEHFAQRVDQGRLMLPFSQPVDEGEWAQFQVLYADGSVAMEGTGKVSGAYDNGEEHPAEYRYDIVLEELALDGTSEVVFERIAVARESMMGAEPGTGEVSLAEVEQAEAAAEAPAEEPMPEPEAPAEEAAYEASEDAVDEVIAEAAFVETTTAVALEAPRRAPAAAPAAPLAAPRANPRGEQPAPGKLPTPHSFASGVLTRPVLAPAWEPAAEIRPEPAQSSGLFDYASGGLPLPSAPPRPDLPDEARVGHAPAPEA